MAIDSVCIRGQEEPNRLEVTVEMAVAGEEGLIELSLLRGDVLEDCAVIEIKDLLTAIQVLRGSGS